MGRPIRLFLTAGQTSDDIGARGCLTRVPSARALHADRGRDADGFRSNRIERATSPSIPGHRCRKKAVEHDSAPYRQRHRIENGFARLKDWPVVGEGSPGGC